MNRKTPIEFYNLKYSNTEPLNLFFINSNTREAIKFNPVYKYENKEINLETMKLVLQELGITLVPYEKLFNSKGEENYSPYDNVKTYSNDYRDSKYPKGTSGYLPNSSKPVIAVNPTSEYKIFVQFHEISHILLKHKGNELTSQLKELEANLTAFLVINQFSKKADMVNIIGYFDLHLIDIPFQTCTKCMKVANDILTIVKENMLYDF